MAGTKAGGLKAAQTLKHRDPNYYSKIGAMGGASVPEEKHTFNTHPGLAAKAGRKGGKTSRPRST